MAAGVNWVSDQWTAVMYMYLQSLDPSRWGWEALKAVAYCFFRFFQTNTQFNSLSKTLVWYWVCTFEVPCLGMVVIMMGRWNWKKETNLPSSSDSRRGIYAGKHSDNSSGVLSDIWSGILSEYTCHSNWKIYIYTKKICILYNTELYWHCIWPFNPAFYRTIHLTFWHSTGVTEWPRSWQRRKRRRSGMSCSCLADWSRSRLTWVNWSIIGSQDSSGYWHRSSRSCMKSRSTKRWLRPWNSSTGSTGQTSTRGVEVR